MKYFVVDAFSDTHFGGNPAGVCLLERWPEAQLMQNIAFENGLAETAFMIKREGYYDLRWFTPKAEIDLCGHATLGSAYVLFTVTDPQLSSVEFHTQSGPLFVKRNGDVLVLDFPSRMPAPCPQPEDIEEALGVKVVETHIKRDLLVLLENEAAVKAAQPKFALLTGPEYGLGVIVTARGETCDFVSRFFAPKVGVNEDPVTGSSHTELIPFWSRRLNKTEMVARQPSQRGGTLYCKDDGERVEIGGKASLYLAGEILI